MTGRTLTCWPEGSGGAHTGSLQGGMLDSGGGQGQAIRPGLTGPLQGLIQR